MDGIEPLVNARGQQKFDCTSPKQLMSIGKRLARECKGGELICLYGNLGAGKTTCVKGIAQGLKACHPNALQSPTFTYLHGYEGRLPLYHFDLYRLRDPEEFLAMGFDDYLFTSGICCIEWPERIESFLSDKKRIELIITAPQMHLRHLSIRYINYD